MDKYVFVKLNHDYSDEFDVVGCTVMSEDEWNRQYSEIKRGFDQQLLNGKAFYFGTNEALTFNSFEHFDAGVDVCACSKQFHDEFKKLTFTGRLGYWVVEHLLEATYE
jgi:hypothetical protein